MVYCESIAGFFNGDTVVESASIWSTLFDRLLFNPDFELSLSRRNENR